MNAPQVIYRWGKARQSRLEGRAGQKGEEIMIWGICFALALVCAAAGAAGFMLQRKRGKDEVRYLGAGVFLACISICFPVMSLSEQAGFAFAMSVSQSIRMFVVDTGVSDILEQLTAERLGALLLPYKTVVCLLYMLAPVFTLSVVLRYFSNFFERFRLVVRGRRDLYVFSDLNPRSLEIAAGLRAMAEAKGKKTGIVFCESNEKDDLNTQLEQNAKELGAVFVAGEMIGLKLNNRKRYTAYFHISDDDEKNIDNTLQMIDNMTGYSPWLKSGRLDQKKTAVYCYASASEAEILIDAKDKEQLRVVLMNEVRDAVYEHLFRYPLYTCAAPPQNGDRGRISVLIVGGGKPGLEFLKAAVWCGQMKDYDLDIRLIDVKGNLIRKKLQEECPELLMERSGYQIDIHKGNVFSSVTERYLDSAPDITYCVVCLGEDEDAIHAALWLKKYFYMKNRTGQPLISVYIESSKKRTALWNLYENTRNKERVYYNIIPFGSRKMYFGDQSDPAFILEYLGLGVQAHYDRLDKDSTAEQRSRSVRSFYEKQFNRRSSIASGMHMSYKLWEMGYGILRVPGDAKARTVFDRYIHPVDFAAETAGRRQPFYDLEHERWMAYTRAEGWRLSTRSGEGIGDIRACYEEYCEVFKNQNYMMKLHPALVPLRSDTPARATLQEVDDMIVEVNKEKGLKAYLPDFVQSDVELVDHIGDIVEGAWCGSGGVNIHGTPARSGACVICRLEDLLNYCRYLYEVAEVKGNMEQIISLRMEMQRCRRPAAVQNENTENENAEP